MLDHLLDELREGAGTTMLDEAAKVPKEVEDLAVEANKDSKVTQLRKFFTMYKKSDSGLAMYRTGMMKIIFDLAVRLAKKTASGKMATASDVNIFLNLKSTKTKVFPEHERKLYDYGVALALALNRLKESTEPMGPMLDEMRGIALLGPLEEVRINGAEFKGMTVGTQVLYGSVRGVIELVVPDRDATAYQYGVRLENGNYKLVPKSKMKHLKRRTTGPKIKPMESVEVGGAVLGEAFSVASETSAPDPTHAVDGSKLVTSLELLTSQLREEAGIGGNDAD